MPVPQPGFILLDKAEQFMVGMADLNTLCIVVPDTPAAEAALKEMATAKKAVLQFVNPGQVRDVYTTADIITSTMEIVFDDGTPAPFAWSFERRQLQGKLPLADELKRLLVMVNTNPATPPALVLPITTDFALRVNEQGKRTITSNHITTIFTEA